MCAAHVGIAPLGAACLAAVQVHVWTSNASLLSSHNFSSSIGVNTRLSWQPFRYALLPPVTQVLILPNFQDFPSDALTVEFWMMSVDTCRPGVPFSYAVGQYEKEDNSFLIFNYNSL
jgi:hypothetical protein